MPLMMTCAAADCSPSHESAGKADLSPNNSSQVSASPTRHGHPEHIDKDRKTILAKLPTAIGGDGSILLGTLHVAHQCIYATNANGNKFLIATTTNGATWEDGALEVTQPSGKIERFRDGDPVQLGGSSASANVQNVVSQLIVKPWPDCDQNRVWVTSMIARGK